jgi:hypothetical protein
VSHSGYSRKYFSFCCHSMSERKPISLCRGPVSWPWPPSARPMAPDGECEILYALRRMSKHLAPAPNEKQPGGITGLSAGRQACPRGYMKKRHSI